MRVLNSQPISTGNPDSRLRFEAERGAAGIGNRYLLIDGKRAYNLGIDCQTCSLLFERLSGANQSVEIEKTAEALRKGVQSLVDPIVEVVGAGLPKGEYVALLTEAPLSLVYPNGKGDYFCEEQMALWGEDTFWCLPHDPRIPYFRAGESDIGESRRLFNFIVPMYPTKWLTFRPPSEYQQELRERGTGTAVALSILDVRGPAIFQGDPIPDPLEHWCFTHYVIDGHHKLHAASESGKPLNILSFVALAHCASSRDQIEQAVNSMGS
jgi:hypothetical protein